MAPAWCEGVGGEGYPWSSPPSPGVELPVASQEPVRWARNAPPTWQSPGPSHPTLYPALGLLQL